MSDKVVTKVTVGLCGERGVSVCVWEGGCGGCGGCGCGGCGDTSGPVMTSPVSAKLPSSATLNILIWDRDHMTITCESHDLYLPARGAYLLSEHSRLSLKRREVCSCVYVCLCVCVCYLRSMSSVNRPSSILYPSNSSSVTDLVGEEPVTFRSPRLSGDRLVTTTCPGLLPGR